MSQLEQFLSSTRSEASFQSLEASSRSAQVQHRSIYEVFEAERVSAAASSEASPVVLWARSSPKSRTESATALANRVQIKRSAC